MEKCVLEFKVVPGASCTEIADAQGNIIRIRIAAPPEKGKANKELLRFLVKLLGVRKANTEILSGKTSRRKRVIVKGLSEEKARQALLNPPKGKSLIRSDRATDRPSADRNG